jgi:hypothetical protein
MRPSDKFRRLISLCAIVDWLTAVPDYALEFLIKLKYCYDLFAVLH